MTYRIMCQDPFIRWQGPGATDRAWAVTESYEIAQYITILLERDREHTGRPSRKFYIHQPEEVPTMPTNPTNYDPELRDIAFNVLVGDLQSPEEMSTLIARQYWEKMGPKPKDPLDQSYEDTAHEMNLAFECRQDKISARLHMGSAITTALLTIAREVRAARSALKDRT